MKHGPHGLSVGTSTLRAYHRGIYLIGGYAKIPEIATGFAEAFRWTATSGLMPLGFLPGDGASSARGMSADGMVIVGISSGPGGNRAFRWTMGTGMVPIGGGTTSANGASADGSVIVGNGQFGSGLEAYRWTSAGVVPLGDFPGGDFRSEAFGVSADGAVVVGSAPSGAGREAYRWTQSTGMVGLGIPAGAISSEATAVSADGTTVVGVVTKIGGDVEAFRWTQSTGMELIGGSQATDVSGDGSVVVGVGGPPGSGSGFIWDPVNGTRNLQDVLITDFGLGPPLAGRSFRVVGSISADGHFIVGDAFNPNGIEAWLVQLDADSDGDGVPDDEDDCPNSDLNPTVVIDGCDSGVANTLCVDDEDFGNGCTIADLIMEIAANANNHGQFVSGVAQLTNDLKKAGIISGSEKGAMQDCAAQSSLP